MDATARILCTLMLHYIHYTCTIVNERHKNVLYDSKTLQIATAQQSFYTGATFGRKMQTSTIHTGHTWQCTLVNFLLVLHNTAHVQYIWVKSKQQWSNVYYNFFHVLFCPMYILHDIQQTPEASQKHLVVTVCTECVKNKQVRMHSTRCHCVLRDRRRKIRSLYKSERSSICWKNQRNAKDSRHFSFFPKSCFVQASLYMNVALAAACI